MYLQEKLMKISDVYQLLALLYYNSSQKKTTRAPYYNYVESYGPQK